VQDFKEELLNRLSAVEIMPEKGKSVYQNNFCIEDLDVLVEFLD
jgi:hypothetical protein